MGANATPWWSDKALGKLALPVGKWTICTGERRDGKLVGQCWWIPEYTGQASVSGYVKIGYRLKAGRRVGKVTRRLLRLPFGKEAADETWLDDVYLPRLGAAQERLEAVSPAVNHRWHLAPWPGAVDKGRGYRLELTGSDDFAELYVTTRYLKAHRIT